MTKNCGYNSHRKWLSQNQTIPGAQAYTIKSNELVEMMNIGLFEPDPFKPKNLRKGNRNKKKEDKETIEAIIKSNPNDITPVELDPAVNKLPDSEESESDSEESIGEDLDTSNETEKSSEKDNA